MGSPSCSVAIVSSSIRLAFRQLGNGISVLHALLATLVAKTALAQLNVSIGASIVECFSHRILPDERQIFQRNGLIVICRESKVEDLFATASPIHESPPAFIIKVGETEHCAGSSATIHGFLVKTGWDSLQIESFKCYDQERCIAVHCPIGELVRLAVHASCRAATIAILGISKYPSETHQHELVETIEDSENEGSVASTWSCTASELNCIESESHETSREFGGGKSSFSGSRTNIHDVP